MLGINRFRRDIQTQGNKGQAQLLNIRGVSGSETPQRVHGITSVSPPLSVPSADGNYLCRIILVARLRVRSVPRLINPTAITRVVFCLAPCSICYFPVDLFNPLPETGVRNIMKETFKKGGWQIPVNQVA